MGNLRAVTVALFTLLVAVGSLAQNTNEILLSDSENAYNPIPSPDGQLIAYVRTGWGRKAVFHGFGRSNLRSELAVMTASGDLLTRSPLADTFLFGWTRDSNDLICSRDGRFLLVGPYGGISREERETGAEFMFSERVAYLASSDTFVWVEHQHQPSTQILTPLEPLAEIATMTGNLVIPSPDERYIALAGNGMDLWVYDTQTKKWANLGHVDIHPNTYWDEIKPSWNPWFADSSRLVFFSGSRLVVASPDGRSKAVLLNLRDAGLPVPSPDGKRIAFVSFVPRPMKLRPDLKFWGGSSIFVVSVNKKGKPLRVTSPTDDSTYDLNWVGNDRLVFDRIADEKFYAHARLWTVTVPNTARGGNDAETRDTHSAAHVSRPLPSADVR